MNPPVPEYSKLRVTPTLLSLPVETAMAMAAQFVDGACDHASATDLEHAIKLIAELQGSSIEARHAAELHYYAANAWAGLRAIRHPDQQSQWQWRQPEMEHELLALRKAIHSEGFASLLPGRRAQVLTNTGNLLNTIGRSLDALPLYDEAMRTLPAFGMAMANQGFALKTFARSHYDEGQAYLLLHRSWRKFTDAPSKHLEPGAEKFFKQHAEEIQSWLSPAFLKRKNPAPRVSLGKSKGEQRYRQWALRERLFLNPLIALGMESVAARDTLNLPGIVVDLGEAPGLLGMFTQIKQEFVSARLLAWEGASAKRRHFSDRETHLVDTLDYAVYGLALEKTKVAYRMAYSILDKCAFLLNKYLDLKLKDTEVSLNTVWFIGGKPDPAKPNFNLNPAIVDSDNWPLRGLFWLARDIHDRDALRDPVDPGAQELKSILDHLEHKYLKVHDLMVPTDGRPDGHRDQYAKSIRRDSLEAKTLTLLRLARSAITYLSLGIHAEERKRARERKPGGITPPMFLPKVPDDWKR